MLIRAARAAELAALQDIEIAAGRSFRDVGMPEIAGDQPLPLDELAGYQLAGQAWVAAGGARAPGCLPDRRPRGRQPACRAGVGAP